MTTKHIPLLPIGAIMFLFLTEPAAAAFSSVVSIDNNDCDCSVTAKANVLVDNFEDYDHASDLALAVRTCSFCPALSAVVNATLSQSAHPRGSSQWGDIVYAIWGGEYTPGTKYYATTGNSYRAEDLVGNTNLSDVSLTDSETVTPETEGEGDCGVGSPE